MTLAERGREALDAPPTQRPVQVLFDELPQQPQEHLQLPVSGHPKIRRMADTMARDPAHWQTLSQWAAAFAMSERNPARLVVRETGLSFRRWRHQLQLIPGAADAGARTDGTANRPDARLRFNNRLYHHVQKGLGQTPGRYHASLAKPFR